MIIAIDSSTRRGILCGLSEVNGQWTTSFLRGWLSKTSHSEAACQALAELRQSALTDWSQVSGLMVGLGPGSFTGVRVGVNLIRALGFSLNLPVLAVDSLRLMAESLDLGQREVWIAVTAQQDMVYCARFRQSPEGFLRCEEGPRLERLAQIKSQARQGLDVVLDPEISIEGILRTWKSHLDQSTNLTWREVLPLYLRQSAAEEKLASGALRPTKVF